MTTFPRSFFRRFAACLVSFVIVQTAPGLAVDQAIAQIKMTVATAGGNMNGGAPVRVAMSLPSANVVLNPGFQLGLHPSMSATNAVPTPVAPSVAAMPLSFNPFAVPATAKSAGPVITNTLAASALVETGVSLANIPAPSSEPSAPLNAPPDIFDGSHTIGSILPASPAPRRARVSSGLAVQLEALARPESGTGEAIARLLQGGALDGVKLEQVTPRIYHLNFPSQYLMAATFLRFQEHYESPKFRGRVFDLETYMDWYAKTNGNFTYHQDWGGFNIPSRVLRRFYAGEFGALTRKEQAMLDIFHGKKGHFYIIGTTGSQNQETLRHEISHGLFYTNRSYKRQVLDVLKGVDAEGTGLNHFLATKGGYHPRVWVDEAHAYIGGALAYLESQGIATASLEAAHHKLRALFDKYFAAR